MSVSSLLVKNNYDLFCGSMTIDGVIGPHTGFTGPIGPTGATGQSIIGPTGATGTRGATGRTANLNTFGGLTASSQSLVTNTSGFTITSSANDHLLNIDNAVSVDLIFNGAFCETKSVSCKYSMLGKLRQITIPSLTLSKVAGSDGILYVDGLPSFLCGLENITQTIRLTDNGVLRLARVRSDFAELRLIIENYPSLDFSGSTGLFLIDGFTLNYFYIV
jgi:hypothetical protein